MNQLQTYIHQSRYARWIESENRREAWEETVSRYISFFAERTPEAKKVLPELKQAILDMKIMPSMRAFMTAGKALEKDEVAGYNCSFVAVDDVRAFDEAMYISMCGTGVGFSVERQFVSQLPTVAEAMHKTDTVIKVKDSKIGWASSFRELLSLLYSGQVPSWDVSALRPAGAPLKTFGGRASGPAPLENLFNFCIQIFSRAVGRKLSSLECHDIMCKVADVVVSGGVRRSAMISLSNLSDDRMRNAKNGQWWETEPQRALSNNSAAYTEKPEIGIFMKEWLTLYESHSGERGIFNRIAAKEQCRKTGRRDDNHDFGTNPCGEIILRSKQFCNLTEVVVRNEDTAEELIEKVKLATILGTLQSTLTNFRYLRKEWKKNCEEERLLGVSMTGLMDNPLMTKNTDKLKDLLTKLRETAVETNKEWADKLGVNQSTAITCVKPSGTVSQLVDSASGIHPRYSQHYIRRVRADQKDPLGAMMKAQGVPCEPDVTKPESVDVFSFFVKSPKGCVLRNDMNAIDQLELYLTYKNYWCEHNPSITVYVRESEWMSVGAWVYQHFNDIGGVSFLPHSDSGHIYAQAPYEEIDEKKFKELLPSMPAIDWSKLKEFELVDSTTSTKELACSAGACEII